MSSDWEPLFIPSPNPQIEPDYDPVRFQRQDEQYFAAFFPFKDDLPDPERKRQVEAWINHKSPYSHINTVMWLDSNGIVQLFDQSMNPVPMEGCVFEVKTLRPEVALKDSTSFDIYKKGLQAYWEKVIHLNTNIYILEKLHEFPWSDLTTRNKAIFFAQTFENYMDISTIIINSILGDEDNNTIINIFMNKVGNNLVREEFKSSFHQHLKKTKAEANFKHLNVQGGLLKRVKNWRNTVIAHFKEWRLTNANPPPDVTRIDFTELRLLIDTLNKLFHSLTFNVEYLPYQMDYNPKVIHNQPYQTDIEDVLDNIAKESYRLNMPEAYPDQWKYLRPNLTQNQIDAINKYRIKFGLNPA